MRVGIFEREQTNTNRNCGTRRVPYRYRCASSATLRRSNLCRPAHFSTQMDDLCVTQIGLVYVPSLQLPKASRWASTTRRCASTFSVRTAALMTPPYFDIHRKIRPAPSKCFVYLVTHRKEPQLGVGTSDVLSGRSKVELLFPLGCAHVFS